MRSGTATLNRRATGFAAGAFFLLLAAIPMNSLRRYYRTPTVYHPATKNRKRIMQEPDTERRQQSAMRGAGGTTSPYVPRPLGGQPRGESARADLAAKPNRQRRKTQAPGRSCRKTVVTRALAGRKPTLPVVRSC
jgi:hypothetical protein